MVTVFVVDSPVYFGPKFNASLYTSFLISLLYSYSILWVMIRALPETGMLKGRTERDPSLLLLHYC